MNHETARLLIGADPRTVTSELAQHLAACRKCSQFHSEMVDLDNKTRRTLIEGPVGVPVARQTVAAITFKRTWLNSARAGWAAAASVALLTLTTIWAVRPEESLAHDLVQHVQLEPGSWISADPPAPGELRQILGHAGIDLAVDADKVVYARTCAFRGQVVQHLVISTPQGRATVLILPIATYKSRTKFHAADLAGVIIPAAQGSIAVLMQGHANIDVAVREVERSVHRVAPPSG